MEFDRSLVFLFKAVFFGAASLLVIPREIYRKLFIYAFLFGAIGDTIMVFILSMLGLVQYTHMGPFRVLGMFSFWTPLAWMFTFMLFFYFLPTRKIFIYPYVLGFAIFGYMVGEVLQGFDVFRFVGINVYLAPVIFTIWFATAAWSYAKLEHIELH